LPTTVQSKKTETDNFLFYRVDWSGFRNCECCISRRGFSQREHFRHRETCEYRKSR